MIDVNFTTAFKKDYKRIKKRGYELKRLFDVLETLQKNEKLDKKYNDHALHGNWSGHRELHILPDWLLIYYLKNGVLYCVRTGTHAELLDL